MIVHQVVVVQLKEQHLSGKEAQKEEEMEKLQYTK